MENCRQNPSQVDSFSKNKEHFDLILVDKEGTDIHCRVPTALKQTFDSVLTVNNTYTISNFQVMLNDLMFKPSQHKYMLTFTGGTSVSDKNKHDIPQKPLIFTPFCDILAGKGKNDVLIDIIGIVVEIGYSQIHNSTKKQQVNLVLKDLGNNILNCTLWESYAVQFHDFNTTRKDFTGPTVIILQFARVKEEGKYPLCVSNTFNVTKLHINDDLPEIQDFLKSIQKLPLGEIGSQSMTALSQQSQTSGSIQLSPLDKFMYKAMVIPLSDVVKLKDETQCITIAETLRIKAAPGGWFYRACHACPRVAKGNQPPYVCGKGHGTETEIYRYKILIDVVHNGCETTFVLWDRECLQLLKVTSAQMRATMLEAGITDPLEFPLALDGLVGLKLVFKVKWQPSWNNATVVSIYDDKAAFKQLEDSMDQALAPSLSSPTPNKMQAPSLSSPTPNKMQVPSLSSPTPNKMEIVETVTESLPIDDWNMVDQDIDVTSNQIMLTPAPSATSKNDASQLSTDNSPMPTTPAATAKRIAPQVSSDDTLATAFCEEQGSSTKLKKIIKLEKNSQDNLQA
ncbi:uncharacterized protein LOC131608135 isoform X3 [Vicia villosa]|uniref:uncharacterized protein LOC131608135 isoform X3 n=1 Tax=Vicia villosa TaxID=3911 RepID=UPI00273B009D|nr:uncharacterized protein LOC131608135 isoform X3 [Vicia villosa]